MEKIKPHLIQCGFIFLFEAPLIPSFARWYPCYLTGETASVRRGISCTEVRLAASFFEHKESETATVDVLSRFARHWKEVRIKNVIAIWS
jgi:hypothetical protein